MLCGLYDYVALSLKIQSTVEKNLIDYKENLLAPFSSNPLTHTFTEPSITVGIMDHRKEVTGCFEGYYGVDGIGQFSGNFTARDKNGAIVLFDANGTEIIHGLKIRCTAQPDSLFHISEVTIGIDFHWERKEEQVFQGNLILALRKDGMIAVINEINLEDYLKSVISSEMNSRAPREFLKAHAILSRSWLMAALNRKKVPHQPREGATKITEHEIVRWYDREDHDLYDVCADDHCQRYQGITKIISKEAIDAVRQTHGQVITSGETICDARYSKACGGLTENYGTAWDDREVHYLTSISDSSVPHRAIRSEEEAEHWISSRPVVYCNTNDTDFLENVLRDFDRETRDFFRWKIEYAREELEMILQEKSGFDFGTLQNIVPLHRGPSGRISRLKIVGSKKSIIVGKELEIRRWLSRSHLYSSAFVVKVHRDKLGEIDRFVLYGSGWGHGVGLCQIGAAVMASKGFTAGEILNHYFPGTEIQRLY